MGDMFGTQVMDYLDYFVVMNLPGGVVVLRQDSLK